MKSKDIIQGLIMALTIMLAFTSHTKAMADTGFRRGDMDIHAGTLASSSIEPESIHFDAGMVKSITCELSKNHKQLSKYKPFKKENEQIRPSVEDYIFNSNTSSRHCPGLSKLRRLNT